MQRFELSLKIREVHVHCSKVIAHHVVNKDLEFTLIFMLIFWLFSFSLPQTVLDCNSHFSGCFSLSLYIVNLV